MADNAFTVFVIAVALLIVALASMGCVDQQGSAQQPRGGYSGSNSTFHNATRGAFGNGNMTAGQRQALQAQMQASEQQACSGKNQGDSCTLTFGGFGQSNQTQQAQAVGQTPQAGNGQLSQARTMTGTCEAQDGTSALFCRAQRPPQ